MYKIILIICHNFLLIHFFKIVDPFYLIQIVYRKDFQEQAQVQLQHNFHYKKHNQQGHLIFRKKHFYNILIL